MTDVPTLADAAARYARAGWPVHPLHDTTSGRCSCTAEADCRQAGKHPRSANGFHDASTDLRVVERCWRRWPNANIGIATGATSRMVVVDLDGDAGLRTWRRLINENADVRTAAAQTPHGRHHWFRLPTGLSVPRSIRGLGDGVDVLGNDGYAIAPPSAITCCSKSHRPDDACGHRYSWSGPTTRLAPLPDWVPRILDDRRHRGTGHTATDTTPGNPPGTPHHRVRRSHRQVRHPRRYAVAALRGEAQRVASAPAGQRNDALNYAAWRLAEHLEHGALTHDEIATALANAADGCGLTDDDGARAVRNTINSGLRSHTARSL
jgi:hypothetical protein